MNVKFSLFGFLTVCLFCFSACQQEALDQPMQFQDESREIPLTANLLPQQMSMDVDERQAVCLEVLYPLTYDLPDGTEISGEDASSVASALRAWMQANPDVEGSPMLQFPIQILFKGERQTVESMEALRAFSASCSEPEVNPTPCLEILYPLTYILPDSSEIRGTNPGDLALAVREWFANNPEVEGNASLKFPIMVNFNGEPFEVIDQETLNRFRAACSTNEENVSSPCFVFAFPLAYVMPDGTEIAGDSEETLNAAIRDWYAANPEVTQSPTLQFPVTIILKDRTKEVIEDEEALATFEATCE